MCTLKPNSTCSFSLYPTRQNTQLMHSMNSLFEEQLSVNDPKFTHRRLSSEEFQIDDIQTIPQYDSVDEHAPTLQDDEFVMCVNCYDYILIDNVDKHSQICIQEVKSYKKILRKLEDLLYEIREKRLSCAENYSLPLILLEEIGKKVAENSSVRFIQEFTEVFERLNGISVEYSHLPYILVTCKRISSLCEVLSSLPVPSHPEYKSKTQTPQNRESPVPEADSFLSLLSDFDNLPNGRVSPTSTPESLEKYFYTQCVKQKSLLPLSHPNRHLSVFSLYESCISQSIPTHLWTSFIRDSYVLSNISQ